MIAGRMEGERGKCPSILLVATGQFSTTIDLWPDKFNNDWPFWSQQIQVYLYSYVENGQPNYENGQSEFGLFCKNVLPKLKPYFAHCPYLDGLFVPGGLVYRGVPELLVSVQLLSSPEDSLQHVRSDSVHHRGGRWAGLHRGGRWAGLHRGGRGAGLHRQHLQDIVKWVIMAHKPCLLPRIKLMQ